MSFAGAAPEPKKFFLNLLINLDFQVANSLYRAKNYTDAINGMAELLSIIGCQDTDELKPLAATLTDQVKTQSATVDDLIPQFEKLQKYLLQHWLSELRLGIIPTSTLPGDEKRPEATPMDPNQTSRI